MMLETPVDSATSSFHAFGMAKAHLEQPPSTAARQILARNLTALMDLKDWNQVELARRSGVSQRHISDILNQRTDATAGMIDKLAKAFGREGFELQIDGLHSEAFGSTGNLASIVSAYVTDPETRRFLDAAFDLSPLKKRR